MLCPDTAVAFGIYRKISCVSKWSCRPPFPKMPLKKPFMNESEKTTSGWRRSDGKLLTRFYSSHFSHSCSLALPFVFIIMQLLLSIMGCYIKPMLICFYIGFSSCCCTLYVPAVTVTSASMIKAVIPVFSHSQTATKGCGA